MFKGMKIYTVHIKPGMAAAQQKPVFVKEGFNFWAFLLTLLWTLYNRLWLASLLVLAFNALVLFMLKNHMISAYSVVAIDVGFHLIVGFLANDWVRAKLARRGYIMADISASDSLLRAEQRYFERVLVAA